MCKTWDINLLYLQSTGASPPKATRHEPAQHSYPGLTAILTPQPNDQCSPQHPSATMRPAISAAIHQVWDKVNSPSGLPFPATVAALTELGVTRYRVDYVAGTVTAYIDGQDGISEVDIAPLASPGQQSAGSPEAKKWDAEALVKAIRGAQAGTIGNYHDFSKAAVAAGVTDYVCYIKGQRVVYLGGLGDGHTEWFPGAKP